MKASDEGTGGKTPCLWNEAYASGWFKVLEGTSTMLLTSKSDGTALRASSSTYTVAARYVAEAGDKND